jgi:hypothetical protein
MIIEIIAHVLQIPLVIVSDKFPFFDVLERHDEVGEKTKMYLCNTNDSHFDVLFPLRANKFYPSFSNSQVLADGIIGSEEESHKRLVVFSLLVTFYC